jgi:urocanate hydratase
MSSQSKTQSQAQSITAFQAEILAGIPNELPPYPSLDPSANRAPKRPAILNADEEILAVKNALRYFPTHLHEILALEFAQELRQYGRIYAYRYMPTYPLYARPIDAYPGQSQQAKAIMLMLHNNLDPQVAQHPLELITYGGTGTVFQNWAQYRLCMQYLAQMTDEQTLVLYSGHPLGLFPSSANAPRVIVTNGMMIPNYSSRNDYDRFAALGVTSYGQMTAGSFMYIGPQGIVHGTTITLLNAARKYLQLPKDQDLGGILWVTAGLGGMSGAQPKAADIVNAVSITAEINPKALLKRHAQGWVKKYSDNVDQVIDWALEAKAKKEGGSIAYLGNVVDLWERLVERNIKVELGSDQTSLHNPYLGGYYPVGLSLAQSNQMMVEQPEQYALLVQESIRRHFKAIHTMVERLGMYFWDYGNAFLLEASRANAQGILKANGQFVYPSYVEDLMGPMCFDYGFGPFRWVCTSGSDEDLTQTDLIALGVLEEQLKEADEEITQQIQDNILWIKEAKSHQLVVGSKARILYADRIGRMRIALALNQAIKNGKISAPIVLGRDHHDVSGTDSPYRETSNIYDGSRFTADMAVHNFVGDSFRGATWVSLHNGGGVGWGEVINGGFGLVLDGSDQAEKRAESMLCWDVSNGLARRAWAGNVEAQYAIKQAMKHQPQMQVTMGFKADEGLIEKCFKSI